MTRTARRGPWLLEEDQALMELVQTQGPNNWVRISQQLQHRSPKQCRERYHQNLKPSLNHDPISAQEGEMIEQMVHEMGKRWAEIARRLGNRSDNAVKNWWNGSMNRRKRPPISDPGIKLYDEHTHQVSPVQSATTFNGELSIPYTQQHQRQSFLSPTEDGRSWPSPSYAFTTKIHPPKINTLDQNFRSTTFPGPSEMLSPATSQFRAEFSLSQPDLSSLRRRSGQTPVITQLPPLRLSVGPRPQPGWHSPSFMGSEQVLISPALSDTSQCISSRKEPSLISDNQSTYSNSPRHITSPRSSFPTIHDNASQISSNNRPSITTEIPQIRTRDTNSATFTDEEDVATSVTSLNSGYLHGNTRLKTSYSLSNQSDTKLNSGKDTRMNLSNLIE